mgnify:CR=1 FL=1
MAEAYGGKYKGTKVTMEGPFTDNDALKFDESVKAFEAGVAAPVVLASTNEKVLAIVPIEALQENAVDVPSDLSGL